MRGSLILETGEIFSGEFSGGQESVGELVFNTSHSGYEEIATDPSYYNQIMVFTSSMQGNYGESNEVWESEKVWIKGCVCLEMQNSKRDSSWHDKLLANNCSILSEVDTRKLVLHLRDKGTVWAAMVEGDDSAAKAKGLELIASKKVTGGDWTKEVCTQSSFEIEGQVKTGPKVAVIDFGCKKNILRELQERCSLIKVFPSDTDAESIKSWGPDAIFLSNGPGDPAEVKQGTDTVKSLLGYKYIFGICMGHQVLSMALGGETYKLKFGHRGSNHPIRDHVVGRIYMSAQNHGYAVDQKTLPNDVEITHMNLNDNVVSGIKCDRLKCSSVQFHPESHPGPNDAQVLFDYFVEQVQKC